MQTIRVAAIRRHKDSIWFLEQLNGYEGTEKGRYKVHLEVFPWTADVLKDFEDFDPHVVFFSDTSGLLAQLTDSEFDVILKFFRNRPGKHALGTHCVFHLSPSPVEIDNRRLAPLFGLDPATEFRVSDDRGLFAKHVRYYPTPGTEACGLWKGIDAAFPFVSHGYPGLHYPGPSWFDGTALRGLNPDNEGTVRVLAQTEDKVGALFNYVTPHFSSLYIRIPPRSFLRVADLSWAQQTCQSSIPDANRPTT